MKVYEVATGREARSINAPPGATYTLGYTGDGKSLVGSHADGTLRAWDAETGLESRNLSSAGYVHAYAFSRDGKLLAYPTGDGSIQLVESAGWRDGSSLEGHVGGTSFLAFDPSGRFLATTGLDGSVKVWDIATKKMVNALATGVGQQSRIAFSADGQTIIVASTGAGADAVVRVFGRKK